MRLARPFATLLVLVLALSACGGGDDDSGTTKKAEKSPSAAASASPTAAVVDCAKVVPVVDVATLAGEAVSPGEPEDVAGLAGCRWNAKSGARVQVIAVSASGWAAMLPQAIGTLLESEVDFAGKDKLEAALKLLEKGGTLDDAEACGIFTTMIVSLQGQPAGATRVVNYVPTATAPQGINAQACEGGRYYSVQLVKPGMKRNAAVETRIQAALARVIG